MKNYGLNEVNEFLAEQFLNYVGEKTLDLLPGCVKDINVYLKEDVNSEKFQKIIVDFLEENIDLYEDDELENKINNILYENHYAELVSKIEVFMI
jgi:phenylalanyl-tRNA synthetase beta subunit